MRSEVEQGIHDFFHSRDFVRIDSPILTPAACEGTSTLFETDYFGDKAYLTQSGQLYLEPAISAFGKVYCFGPTFRAEKSKTRRHLMEFWMVEPEVAFLEFDGLCNLAEEFVSSLVARVLDRCAEDLKVLERDTKLLEAVVPPFPRITYTDAIERLNAKGNPIAWGDDFGADEETLVAADFDRPLMVSRFPTAFKAFYMQPDPENPKVVLGLDILAPEGYGEIIGGSQRIHDHDFLLQRIREHNLPIEAFQWYLDVRKYGSLPALRLRHGPRALRRLDVQARPRPRDHPLPADALQDLPLSDSGGAAVQSGSFAAAAPGAAGSDCARRGRAGRRRRAGSAACRCAARKRARQCCPRTTGARRSAAPGAPCASPSAATG